MKNDIYRKNEVESNLDNYLSIIVFNVEKGSIILWSWIIVYTIILSSYTILKHRTFNSFAWDLGIYNQALWTTVKINDIFFYTCERHLVESGSFFGVHFSPILYCVIPIYHLSPRPETLLIFQSFVLGVAALPVYLLGRKLLNRSWGLVFSASYLLNPAIHGINCYDFHIQSFIPLLTLSFLYFYISKKWTAYLYSTILIFFVEEHLPHVMILYSLLVLIETKKDIQKLIKNSISFKLKFTIPILTAIYSIHWSSLSKKIIRYFNSNIPPILVAGRHFNILGADNPMSIPLYVLKNPLRIINPIRYAFFDKFIYVMCLTGPNLAFSIMSPSTLLPTIPWFTISLLSNYSPYFLIGYQYPSYVLPFILFSTIKGLKKIRTNNKTKYLFLAPEKLMILYLCINLCYFAIASPLSPCTKANTHNPAYKKPDENSHVTSIRVTLDHIPKGASILTQDNIFPHVSSRKNSYVVPPIIKGEYNEWKKSLNSIMNEAPEYILIDPSTDSHEILDPLLDEIDNYNYSIVESADNVFLYKLDNDNDENGIIDALPVPLGMISKWK